MAEFIARDPEAKVMGYIIQGYLAAMGEDGTEIATKYGFDNIDTKGWYPLQSLFHMLHEIAEQGTMNSTMDLVTIGMRASELGFKALSLSPHIQDVFMGMNDAHQQSHIGQVGFHKAELVAPGHISLACHIDYPCDLLQGTWYFTAKITRPPDYGFSVVHRPGVCKKHGDDGCIYDIKWWEESEESEEA